MQKLFKVQPFTLKKIWGYEKWIVSTLKEGQSSVDGKNLFEVLGKNYPLLLKIIQANDMLSVQVHPNDIYAAKHENSFGKTECWYILAADPNAKLVCGLKDFYSRQELTQAINQNTLQENLYTIPIARGDFIYIPAGTVHAICGGLRILEIQQPSDVTYRLYDWGRGRELHIEKSLDVIEQTDKENLKSEPVHHFTGNFSSPYFTVEYLIIRDEEIFPPVNSENHLAYFIVAGEGMFCCENEKIIVQAEDILLVNPQEILRISGNLDIIRIYK